MSLFTDDLDILYFRLFMETNYSPYTLRRSGIREAAGTAPAAFLGNCASTRL
jgi:hypothetical protein